jgi:hypothetical protein
MPVWWGNNGFQWGWVMGLFQRVAVAACVLVPVGPALGQLNQTPADQLREMARIIQEHGTPPLDDLGRPVDGFKQCLTTDSALKSSQVVSYGTNILIEERSTSFGNKGTYYLSRTFEAIPNNQGGVEITKPSLVVFLERTSNSTKQVASLEEINKSPRSIRQGYHAPVTPEGLFADMTRAVYGACLNVEPPSQGDRASVYGGLSVAGVFSGQATFQM